MIKRLGYTILALWAVAVTSTAPAATQTNVLQNVTLDLTLYQQGATNANGRKVADQVTPYTIKNLIAAIGLITTNNFGPGAKLVLCSVYSNLSTLTGTIAYSNAPVLSANLAVPTNLTGFPVVVITNPSSPSLPAASITFSADSYAIIGNQLSDIATGPLGTINGDLLVAAWNTNESVTINTNLGFRTTLTPSANSNGLVTNIAIVTEQAPIESIFTNVANSIDILWGGTNNYLYPVTNYISITNANSTVIVTEAGSGLNTTNAEVSSQTGFSVQNLNINYGGPTNLVLNLLGFVKQTLKVDILSSRNRTKTVADIDNSAWNLIGSGYSGGTFTTNYTTAPVGQLGYLTNANPVVVQGAMTVSFLKNLPQ